MNNATLDLLVAQFPGHAFIPMTQAGAAIGYKAQTCYNLFHLHRFPLPVRKIGGKNMVTLVDLARFMNGETFEVVASNDEKPQQPPAARRPGRPTKKEMIERRRAA